MPQLPGNSHHMAILGSNGSGKTRAAVWHLSRRNYNSMPWVIFDFKRDDLIAQIPATEIDVKEGVPKKPGLYVVRPHPAQQDEVADLLVRIWERGHIGVYVDEGYMIESAEANKAYKLVLTQGRSLKIPTITLSQRPVWINRFVLSEATFYQVFRLNDDRDRKSVQQFMPDEASKALPPFHSWYYNSSKHELDIFGPVPGDEKIIGGFEVATPRKKWFGV